MTTTPRTQLFKVVTNGTESRPMPKKQAERIAKALREGKTNLRRKAHTAPIAAEVVAA